MVPAASSNRKRSNHNCMKRGRAFPLQFNFNPIINPLKTSLNQCSHSGDECMKGEISKNTLVTFLWTCLFFYAFQINWGQGENLWLEITLIYSFAGLNKVFPSSPHVLKYTRARQRVKPCSGFGGALKGSLTFDVFDTCSRYLCSARCVHGLSAPRGSLRLGAHALASKLCQNTDDAHAVENVTQEVQRPSSLLHVFMYNSYPHRRPTSGVQFRRLPRWRTGLNVPRLLHRCHRFRVAC